MMGKSVRYICFLLLLGLQLCATGVGAKNRLTPFLADSAHNTKIAIIVCPGGSYSWLDIATEGEGVAKWLQSNGINAFVLKYRVATVAAYITGFRVLGFGNKYPDMLVDVEEALREVYTRSDEWAIDTSRIGVMGFSAGGHLTMMSYLMNRTAYLPKFLCPVYPVVSMSAKCSHVRSRRGALGVWGQWDSVMRDSLSIEKRINSKCPPVFLVNCKDDDVVDYHNSVLLDSALTANEVSHKYIQYETGGHGFGASKFKANSDSQNWTREFIDWLFAIFR